MPHLMNCSHSDDGWCLDCVKELHDENERLQKRVADLEAAIRRFLVCWDSVDTSYPTIEADVERLREAAEAAGGEA